MLGPHIAVLKTHIDIISDLTPLTLSSLTALSLKHDFLLFEDRKFIDIGSTVQKQYRSGALQIYNWAHIVNAAVLAGPGIIEALARVIEEGEHSEQERGVLVLAEMTSAGSLAVGEYTRLSVEVARRWRVCVLGFVATRELGSVSPLVQGEGLEEEEEDFVVFTTGISLGSKGDALGQQYQSPASAVERGADFLIVGRGIYAAEDPREAAEGYRKAGWEAYLKKLGRT